MQLNLKTQLCSLEEIMERTLVSRSTLWRWEKSGGLPQRVKLVGSNRILYKRDEVEKWIKTLMNGPKS